MSENQSLRVPSCRRHKPSGQAAVTINGQDICPGTWNTRASKAEYDRLIAEFLTHGRQLQSGVRQTVVEVLAAYRAFAENDYRKGDQVTREYSGIKDALKLVRELYDRTIANDFGPLALKTVRQRKSKRTAGEHYTTANCRRAILRACDLAFPAPSRFAAALVRALRVGNSSLPRNSRPNSPSGIQTIVAVRTSSAIPLERRFGNDSV